VKRRSFSIFYFLFAIFYFSFVIFFYRGLIEQTSINAIEWG